MALSPEQISEINRRNAARSTGPKSTVNSCMNSYKHGLRSESLTLPNEPTDWVDKLTAEWRDYYQPQSPGRCALLDRAVLATVHHKRSRRYLTGTVGKQVRGAELAFDTQQQDVVRHYMELLESDPPAATRGLKRSAAGTRRLLTAWVGLESDLLTYGHWSTFSCEYATTLMGHCPNEPCDATAFWIRYNNVAAQEPRDEAALAELTGPWCLHWVEGMAHPTPQECREKLRQTVSGELDELRAHEKRMRTNFEEPDRAAAVEEAMLLAPEKMALWLRYERMHDSMFHRAYNGLERPEAERPDAEPIPDADSQREDNTASSPESESGVEEAAAAGEGPIVPAEAVVERQTKRVATDEPVAPVVRVEPVAVATPAVTPEPVPVPIADNAPAGEGPTVASEPDVERQTKRVATVDPVALPESTGAVISPTPSRELPGEGVGPSEPGRIADPSPAAALERAAPASLGGNVAAMEVERVVGVTPVAGVPSG